MRHRFSPLIRKYSVPYIFVQPAKGEYNDDGEWVTADPQRLQYKGHFQPIKAELKQDDPGRYTVEDKMLYTTHKHVPADIIEYKGTQYMVSTSDERDYCDIHQYLLKKVIAHGPV